MYAASSSPFPVPVALPILSLFDSPSVPAIEDPIKIFEDSAPVYELATLHPIIQL
jgi:hypothetical protein